MPISYEIDVDGGLLFIEAKGETTQPERLEAMRTWQNDPRFRPGLRTLCDCSQAESTPTLPELLEIVDRIKQLADVIGHKKLAIITSRPMIFGVARQFGALAPGSFITVQVFKDRHTALDWLNLPTE